MRKFIFFIFILLTVFTLLLSGICFKNKPNTVILQKITSLTYFPGLAFSTGFLENRILKYQDKSSRIYPQIKYYKQMDYVYDQ